MSYAWLCTVLKLQRASCQIVSVNSVTYHGVDVLRRQGSQVRILSGAPEKQRGPSTRGLLFFQLSATDSNLRFDPRPTKLADRRTNEESAPFRVRAAGPNQSCRARQFFQLLTVSAAASGGPRKRCASAIIPAKAIALRGFEAVQLFLRIPLRNVLRAVPVERGYVDIDDSFHLCAVVG